MHFNICIILRIIASSFLVTRSVYFIKWLILFGRLYILICYGIYSKRWPLANWNVFNQIESIMNDSIECNSIFVFSTPICAGARIAYCVTPISRLIIISWSTSRSRPFLRLGKHSEYGIRNVLEIHFSKNICCCLLSTFERYTWNTFLVTHF